MIGYDILVSIIDREPFTGLEGAKVQGALLRYFHDRVKICHPERLPFVPNSIAEALGVWIEPPKLWSYKGPQRYGAISPSLIGVTQFLVSMKDCQGLEYFYLSDDTFADRLALKPGCEHGMDLDAYEPGEIRTQPSGLTLQDLLDYVPRGDEVMQQAQKEVQDNRMMVDTLFSVFVELFGRTKADAKKLAEELVNEAAADLDFDDPFAKNNVVAAITWYKNRNR